MILLFDIMISLGLKLALSTFSKPITVGGLEARVDLEREDVVAPKPAEDTISQ